MLALGRATGGAGFRAGGRWRAEEYGGWQDVDRHDRCWLRKVTHQACGCRSFPTVRPPYTTRACEALRPDGIEPSLYHNLGQRSGVEPACRRKIIDTRLICNEDCPYPWRGMGGSNGATERFRSGFMTQGVMTIRVSPLPYTSAFWQQGQREHFTTTISVTSTGFSHSSS